MRTEYMFTDAQKARIEQIHKQILDLNIELSGIYAMARIRCVTEHEDEVDSILQGAFYRQAMYGTPIRNDAIVNIKYGGSEDDSRTTETSGGES